MKLIDILKEIGENTGAPYKWKKTHTHPIDPTDIEKNAYREYRFVTEEKPKVGYRVEIGQFLKKNTIVYRINFGIAKGPDDFNNYDVTSKTGKTGNLRRVMSTVIEIIKKEIIEDPNREDYSQAIEISPSKANKDDMRRSNLYMAYIQKNMPQGSEVKMSKKGGILITLPKQKNSI